MSQVVGIDLSMTRPGIARIYGTGPGGEYVSTSTTVFRSSGTRADTLADRGRRITKLKEQVLTWRNDWTTLVVIESPSLGSHTAGTWDRAGLWWQIVGNLLRQDIPVAEISPLSLKKYATGNGRAEKGEMEDAAERLLGYRLPTNDEADGFFLAQAGAHALEMPGLPLLPHQDRSLLKSMKWPESLTIAPFS